MFSFWLSEAKENRNVSLLGVKLACINSHWNFQALYMPLLVNITPLNADQLTPRLFFSIYIV